MRRFIRVLVAACLALSVTILVADAYSASSAARLPRLGALHAGICNAPQDSLQRRLCADMPKVFDPKLGDWQRTTLLRNWAYSHIDASASSLTYDTGDFLTRSAPTIFDDFAKDKAGVYCGNAALALLQLYAYFGYQAWTLDMGLPAQGLTHTVTLVRLPDRNGLIAVQGSFLDGTFETKNGQPLDVRTGLRELAKGQLPRWVTSRHLAPRKLLFADHEIRKSSAYYDASRRCRRTPTGWACPTTLFTMARYASTYPAVPSALRQMRADGHRANILDIFLYPLSVTGRGGQQLLAELKAAAGA